MTPTRVIMMGAGGREFHNFNVLYRDNEEIQVVAFTAYQIPNIAHRIYPPHLAGWLYPQGIPIVPEDYLISMIKAYNVDQVIFSYSDVSHEYVMHRASKILAQGATFSLLGAQQTMIPSTKPVIAVCATRTGSGKSQVSRKIARLLRKKGLRVAALRHPMPYGNLEAQAVQHFSSLEDLSAADCTIEEREEYEPYIEQGMDIYAGVDYAAILKEAEKQADIIIWDGGNNDTSFIKPDLTLVVLDPHRYGHELTYHPGETNLYLADVFLMNKLNDAPAESVTALTHNLLTLFPSTPIIRSNSVISADQPELIKGKRVLVIEDGPTMTHGGAPYGAGYVAAQQYQAKEIIDPRPYAVGSIKEMFASFPHVKQVLPAMGYGERQRRELAETINRVPCESIVVGTPINLAPLLNLTKPCTRITYDCQEIGTPTIADSIDTFVSEYIPVARAKNPVISLH